MRFVRLAPLALPLLLGLPASAELTATFEAGSVKDVRTDRLPALLVKAGESPTPFLAPGQFTTTWTGKITLPKRLRVEFSFEGEGSATLLIDGKEVAKKEGKLDPEPKKEGEESAAGRLDAGDHDITVIYKSKEDGSGRFRLFWEERSFPRQSIPASAFKTETAADIAHAGRFLFAENHCAKCHTPGAPLGNKPMAELNELAPLLFSTGSRLNEQWLAEWIADPSSLRHDTRMPQLVDASTPAGKQQAADLAAYLMTMKIGDVPAAPDKALAQKGGEHFHRFGCIACHTAPDKAGFDTEHGRIPLSNVADKFQPGALAGFLKAPETTYQHIGMPNFRLSDAEANELSSFLLVNSAKVEKKHAEFPKGDAAKGAELAGMLNCGSCHAGLPLQPGSAPALESIFEKDWAASGCVSEKHTAKTPKLALSDDEKLSLIAFAKKGIDSIKRDVPAESAAAKLKALHCTNCHSMDGKPSLLETVHVETKELVAHVHGENEKLDQSRPQLTYIGEMLNASYIEAMVAGTAKETPRPWLDMRMPGFANYAHGMADGLARIHGIEPGKPGEVTQDKAMADIGKALSVGESSFGCTVCHAINKDPATMPFEVQGVNLGLAHERLRHEWFMRWMDNPISITPGSKMPRYGDNNGHTSRPELEGDAAKQFDAIWEYIQKPY